MFRRAYAVALLTYCKSVRVVGKDGNETKIITNETPLA